MTKEPKPEKQQRHKLYTAQFKNPDQRYGMIIPAERRKEAVEKARKSKYSFNVSDIHRAHGYDIVNSTMVKDSFPSKEDNMYGVMGEIE